MLSLLAALAGAPRGMATSAELAERVGVHPVVVRRALAPLRTDGYVESRGGREGGWALARDPATVSLAELVRPRPAGSAGNALASVLAEAEAAYRQRLERATLAEVARWPTVTRKVTERG